MVERFSRIRTLGEKNVGSLTFTRGQKNLTPRSLPPGFMLTRYYLESALM